MLCIFWMVLTLSTQPLYLRHSHKFLENTDIFLLSKCHKNKKGILFLNVCLTTDIVLRLV